MKVVRGGEWWGSRGDQGSGGGRRGGSHCDEVVSG